MDAIINDFKMAKVENLLNEKILKSILIDFKKEIRNEKEIIKKANKIDFEITSKIIKIETLETIIDSYEKEVIKNKSVTKSVVVFNGDPYLTIHILLQALFNQRQILLLSREFMMGVNEVLIAIYQRILKKYKLENYIFYINNFSMIQFKEIKKMGYEIIAIGDTGIYQLIEENKKFYPYNNIILYCMDEELVDLRENIYLYANENQIELEILYEDNLDDAIEYIKSDEFSNVVILLTKNEEIKKEFKQRITEKILYINENPFKEEVGKVYNYFD